MCFATGSSSCHLPSSHSIIIATPTIGLVIDAMRKMVSFVTGFFDLEILDAVHVEVDYFAVARDERRDTGELAVVDQPTHRLLKGLQAR